jgi:hypothetical protein
MPTEPTKLAGSRKCSRLALLDGDVAQSGRLPCSVDGAAGELAMHGGALRWLADVRFADAELRLEGRDAVCVLWVGLARDMTWEAVAGCDVLSAQAFAL